MAKENFLYFAEADVTTGADNASEAYCVPANRYAGSDVGASTTTLNFWGANGDDDATCEVVFTHTAGKNKEVLKHLEALMNSNPTDGFVVMADFEDTTDHTGGTKSKVLDSELARLGVSAVAINDHGVAGVKSAPGAGGNWDSSGAGAVSTAGAPIFTKTRDNGSIVTKILVNLDGLACQGDAANDVIGLAAGGHGYIGRYVTDDMGILYKAEVACLEVPGQQTATITTDIDVAFNSSGTLEYNGAAGTAEINTGGFGHAGALYVGGFVSAPAANDYIYLVEGDTAATTGEYSTGKLMITLYGHPTF